MMKREHWYENCIIDEKPSIYHYEIHQFYSKPLIDNQLTT